MKRLWRSVCYLAVLGGIPVCQAQYRQLSTVHDGSGTMSTNTVLLSGVDYRHVSAAGQPGGIFTSTNGTLVNYAGFLQAVDIKRPDLDTDGDGVIDELSTDNDGDTLTDQEEVEGSEFDPATVTLVNNPDTDGDSVPDGEESTAGTDPTDEDAFLQITAFRDAGGDKVLWWTARDGKQYSILSADGNHTYPTNVE
ncbi:MAG: thrombospondin type 3 repeat-containing protein, partial [Verrucomicrobia bacterium]|nr:thrombospondin type 3 repeat-containing protein [Verrucomicrobiota bacterium]